MSQWVGALDSVSYRSIRAASNAKHVGVSETVRPGPGINQETLELAESLLLSLPSVDWTIEVDILGRHRITVHFKGIDVEVDSDLPF